MDNHRTTLAVPRTAILNGLCALAYFLLANLGFAWGALTANASLLWPASGLVLFALIAFGNSVLPGLFFGALCTSLWLSLSSTLGFTAVSIATASIIAGAAVVQAWLISLFYKKHISASDQTDINTSIKFVLVVMLACTLASSVGNSMLYWTGILSGMDAIKNWSVWWFGDSLGMLVFTPLLLIFQHRSNALFNSQKIIFLAISLGVGVILFAFATLGYLEKQNHRGTLDSSILLLPSFMQLSLLLIGLLLVGL